ncbi:DUF3592 domain-containing protein [Nostoc sp. CMAA1605]|uniref:DUF3592 domain-containing protein n=1 Tax=Nostoc sp. CMAA1605 TaxID=2055159 RepID=UPI001F4399EE|nr:DUF3592 domain-containing protein [Nostoc sp. CMAA1605]MCF4970609.1 DUF3592 domain-containing protein [Nostoc sp. CMAA1605]
MNDLQSLRLFGFIFGGIGSILLVVGIVLTLKTRSFVATSVITQGTVIDFKRRSKVYYPVVEFTPSSGDTTVFEANSGSSTPEFQMGQQVEILYSPQQPNDAVIHSWLNLWLLPATFTGMGAIFFLIGGVALLNSFP